MKDQYTCPNCDPSLNYPGRTIACDEKGKCSKCGRRVVESVIGGVIPIIKALRRWDRYFHTVCIAIASKSPCLSRQIGAILVRDKSIVATGYNGPARGYPHCEGTCPRKLKGYSSGEGLVECPAAHAEGNCVANAARIGASTVGTTLYMNSIVPCKDCMILLVNAGIVEIAIEEVDFYHEMSGSIAYGNISIRKLEL